MNTPYELFGWEIGKGWHPLVKELIEDLQKLGWDGTILQIKEKFGGLRFYIAGGSDEVWDRIERAEKESFTICEECGEPGQLRKRSWIRTLCDKHEKEC